MRKLSQILTIVCLSASLAGANTIARFGIITDIHHTNKTDSTSRKYSAGLAKTQYFVDTMNRQNANFIIELGDYIDTLANNKDPLTNLMEVESIFTSFEGPQYHVLGNHEFDNMTRADLLPNLDNTGIPAGQTYFSFDDADGLHCIVLDADYTNAEPHLPFDLQTLGNSFWNWMDAYIPQTQLDWLTADLAANDKPTVVFLHQVLHRENDNAHTVKNADVVRGILEADGQVLAVFCGHDHRGEVGFVNGIRYFVLEGNVGIDMDWSTLSPTNGYDPIENNAFTMVQIDEIGTFDGIGRYRLSLTGNAHQYDYEDEAQIVAPASTLN